MFLVIDVWINTLIVSRSAGADRSLNPLFVIRVPALMLLGPYQYYFAIAH